MNFTFSLNVNLYENSVGRSRPTDKVNKPANTKDNGERGGLVVECRTPEREVRGSKPTAAVLCP